MIPSQNVKLGKLGAIVDSRTLRLAKYVMPELPPAPVTFDLTEKVSAWGMMRNDVLGDCTCAAAGHLIMEWTANAKRTMVTPSDRQVVAAYSDVTGYSPRRPGSDKGAAMLDVLKYWRKQGIANRKIMAFAEVDLKDAEHARLACYLFGGCYLGIQLPISAKDQNVWVMPPAGSGVIGLPGSWGGHCVPAVGYDEHGLLVVTWGKELHMSWDFYNTYCDEAYCILSKDFLTGFLKNPAGFALADLQSDLAAL